eukprot:CAMPEP_0197539234 /NCGR_PEP_ID=MMETSP1318-20131121/62079_1 /TAXON_ID=552666 /ORGANISM="Partenskyella glossopodia, Strain RCC365" /LENGTH=466 /DNA_ID=CAMNT_0043097899 /DNA_START=12 /DNA_END=1412 /DNA_ORIENTATION=-
MSDHDNSQQATSPLPGYPDMKESLLGDASESGKGGYGDRGLDSDNDLASELAGQADDQPIDHSNRRDIITFFLLGLINNSSFVIFAASAKEISSSSVGIVYLCASLPSLMVRVSAPYWFDKVPYRIRIYVATVLMAMSFTGVAMAPYQWLQLLGVCLTSAQQGLGEASLLALCSRFGTKSLTAWSSGTGVAGLFGYAWVIVFKTWIGLNFRLVLLLANILTVGYVATFLQMRPPPMLQRPGSIVTREQEIGDVVGEGAEGGAINALETQRITLIPASEADTKTKDVVELDLTTWERLYLSLSLWPTTVPLIIVYFAEYATQAGAWASIGFPPSSKEARDRFYEYANWCYQGGVFVSRSSGVCWQPGRTVLWIMALLQVGVLFFFVINAQIHFWYDYSVLSMAFFTGLLGGAVYVNAFRLITESVPPRLKEIGMTAGAVSSDFGTNIGEGLAVLIQMYLYRVNNISE